MDLALDDFARRSGISKRDLDAGDGDHRWDCACGRALGLYNEIHHTIRFNYEKFWASVDIHDHSVVRCKCMRCGHISTFDARAVVDATGAVR